jgi:hypothetical protein
MQLPKAGEANDVSRAAAYELSLSAVQIDPRVNRTRTPLLPAVARGRDFERRFDHLTLFNDVFWDAGGEAVLAIGPHVPAHLDPETGIRFFDVGSGQPLSAEFLSSRLQIHGDMYRIAAGQETSALRVEFGVQQVIVAIQPNLSHLLAGRRVLTNRCQNDPIEWLVDWAYYHAREFGFDAIVHYDNQSTAYTVEDVSQALSQVPGIEIVIVLPWPFPLEPPHALVPATGRIFWHRQMKDRWAESCRLEHQRRRFLEQAELVLVADVDELLIRRNAELDIGELFAEPAVAWARFDSELVVNTEDLPERLVRHRDFHWIWNHLGFKTPKYLVKPDRCPDAARWWLHDITGAPRLDVSPQDYTVAHFFALTTGWGDKHSRAAKHVPAPETHYEDPDLRDTLDRVFDEEARRSLPTPPLPLDNPHLLRRDAYDQMRSGNNAAALSSLERAIAIDSYHPTQHILRNELHAEEQNAEP